MTATERKIARIHYSFLTNGGAYEERGAKAYDEKQHERIVASLRMRA